MRILFDSKKLEHKDPFGCLHPGQSCTLRIHVPGTAQAVGVDCLFCYEDGSPAFTVKMDCGEKQGDYSIYQATFSVENTGLYFYHFYIHKQTGGFRLFKQGNGTNMEAGDTWQLSCVPREHTTPDWAKGAVIYQVFPDRFYKAGECDLTGKLEPYEVHENWDEEVVWKPTPAGEVLNNDFYGGNFKGITEKMDYIASLGVDILYLNPISKSFSSHRYDTGDYKTPDPMLGTLEDFTEMCNAAHRRGIKVILDGVYSHTGSNSLYFDKQGAFGGKGAYCSKESPYYSWYTFKEYPDKYVSWWDFDTLPTVNKMDPAFVDYIITGEDSVIAHWLKLGADGFRLDVVDELPNEFVDILYRHLRKLRPDALLMGEVWEDASNKVAYGIRRRYFVDGVLDSVMNYPYRTAIINFLHGRDDGKALENAVLTFLENYPRQVAYCNMNCLGTHDTPRILSTLIDDRDGTREELSRRKLSPEDLQKAKERLCMATVLQYTFPGCPSIYYADETGMEGGKDPFNRRTYPWGREDQTLLEHFRQLGQLRKKYEALRTGDVEFFHADDGKLGFCRSLGHQRIKIYVNRGSGIWQIPKGKILLEHNCSNGALSPMGWCIMQEAD